MIVCRSVESPELWAFWRAETIAASICWFKLSADVVLLDEPVPLVVPLLLGVLAVEVSAAAVVEVPPMPLA